MIIILYSQKRSHKWSACEYANSLSGGALEAHDLSLDTVRRLKWLSMPNEWNLRYEQWVIADGEPHRRVGEVFDWFVVEFFSDEELQILADGSKSAIAIPDFRYRVVAELVYVSEKACVLDFGLRAVGPSSNLTSGCKRGDLVSGEIGIGIPLCTEIIPEDLLKTLQYRWRVNRVSADVTPYVPYSNNSRWFLRDNSRIEYRDVNSTESLKANSYILHCSEFK